jgi:hypothetical protein
MAQYFGFLSLVFIASYPFLIASTICVRRLYTAIVASHDVIKGLLFINIRLINFNFLLLFNLAGQLCTRGEFIG